MSEYDEAVEKQRKLLEAEEWAKGIQGMHAHSLNSMWYDNRPQDTSEGKYVMDVQYNNGLIQRTCQDGSIVYFGEELTGQNLIDAYEKHGA